MSKKPTGRKRGRPRKHPLPAAAAPAVSAPAAEVLPPDPVRAGLKSLQSSLQNILPADPLPADPQPQPAPAAPPAQPAPDPAAETGSPASGTASDNFERVAATVPPVIGDDPAAAAGSEPAPEGGAPAPLPFDVAVSRETVAHWIKVPFAILARVFDDDGCELEQWEEEIWIPAVQGVLNRYLPEFLRMTDKPELAMLGIAAATYIGMRAKIFFRRKKPAASAPAPRDIPVSMPGDSTTAASRGSSGTLDNLAPAKVI